MLTSRGGRRDKSELTELIVSQHARQRNAVSRTASPVKAKSKYLTAHQIPTLRPINIKHGNIHNVDESYKFQSIKKQRPHVLMKDNTIVHFMNFCIYCLSRVYGSPGGSNGSIIH